jgi:UDP:flavonoid glycosyltransferase YjiC (YdhE family)
MRIVIIATGSRGDVEPYVALGKGLKQAGHTVRLVSHTTFAELVNSQDFEFWPVDVDVQEIAQSPEMRERLGSGSFLSVMVQMKKEAENSAVHLARAGLAACQGMDIILSGVGGLFVAIALAEKLGLPLVQAYYIPFTPTGRYPSFLIPNGMNLGAGLNRLSYQLARQVIWQGFRSADTLVRRNELGLPAAPLMGLYDKKSRRHYPVLYGFSPSVIPQPADWDDHIHITGYWFLEPNDHWTPPQALLDFLDAGPPPIYVGFGSMSTNKSEETTRIILESLEHTGQRGIILSGWGGLQTEKLPGSIFAIDSVPFSWLFPRMAAVVHHGGAGTTAAGLRAGVPSIVVPFFADQPFWAQRVFELGVGPKPIPLKKLTVDRLSQAIELAVNDQGMRQRASAVGVKIRAEDGIANAVAVLQQLE